MTRYFDEELLELNKKILEMSAVVENSIGLSVRALRELSRERLKQSLKMMTGLTPWSSRLRKNV